MSETSTVTPSASADTGSNTSPDQWVRTRMCFCDKDAPTDCRFHSETEKGWEQCPNLQPAQKGKKTGRWLWARNPAFGRISAAAEESFLTDSD